MTGLQRYERVAIGKGSSELDLKKKSFNYAYLLNLFIDEMFMP